MKLCRIGILLAIVGVVLLAPERVNSQGEESVIGHWTYAGEAAERARLKQAIDTATEEMSRVTRGMARKKLLERAEPAKSLVLAVEGEHIVIHRDSLTMRLPRDGSPVVVRENPGHPAVRATLSRTRLTVQGRSDAAERDAHYDLLPNGKLMLSVRITSSRVPAPVVYDLTYRRVE